MVNGEIEYKRGKKLVEGDTVKLKNSNRWKIVYDFSNEKNIYSYFFCHDNNPGKTY